MSAPEADRQFLFCTCQFGAEQACKAEVAQRYPFVTFAFSRPGFLTFKIVRTTNLTKSFCLIGTFVRSSGWSLGSIPDDVDECANEVIKLADREQAARVHVWHRDWALPGDGGFEPGKSDAVERLAVAVAGKLDAVESSRSRQVNSEAAYGDIVLDAILIDPKSVWAGYHVASNVPGRWVGGIPSLPHPCTC